MKSVALLCASVLLFTDAGCSPKAKKPGFNASAQADVHFDVRDYGAVPDGKTKATAAIQKAIAAAAARGGGTIYFPAGQYLTGPIHLKSNITLFVDAGAVLKWSQDFDDYLPMVRVRWEGTEVKTFSPFIYGEKLENIAIHGRGLLDGQGDPWWKFWRDLRAENTKTKKWTRDSKWQKEFARQNPKLERPEDARRLDSQFLRPPFFQCLDCKNISIRDVTLKNSPFWTINPVYCDNLTVSGITIENPDDAPNTDGINPESCRNVHISDSHINVGDDCITIKSGRDAEARRINRPAENYTITNCTMLRGHGGVVIGSEMSGGVRRISISNSVFVGTDRGIRLKSTRGRGGIVEDVQVSNIVMKDIRTEALTLNLFYSDAPPEPFSERTPRFRNIHIDGVTGNAETAALLLGLEESPLENVSFSNINLSAKYGFLVQDARDVRLSSVRIDTETGPAVVARRTEGLDLRSISSAAPHAGTPLIELGNVKRAFVHDCFAAPGTDLFLRVLGPSSDGIKVDGNDLSDVKKELERSAETPSDLATHGTAGGPPPMRSAAVQPGK